MDLNDVRRETRTIIKEYIEDQDCPVCKDVRPMVKFEHYLTLDDQPEDYYRCMGCLNCFKKIMVKLEGI